MTTDGSMTCELVSNKEDPLHKLSLRTLGKVREQSLVQRPNEACGFIVSVAGHEHVHVCRNVAENPTQTWMIDPKAEKEVAERGTIVGVYHSHPTTPPKLSPHDRATSELTETPYLLYSVPWDRFYWYEPEGWEPELLSRPWSHGVFDCCIRS